MGKHISNKIKKKKAQVSAMGEERQTLTGWSFLYICRRGDFKKDKA